MECWSPVSLREAISPCGRNFGSRLVDVGFSGGLSAVGLLMCRGSGGIFRSLGGDGPFCRSCVALLGRSLLDLVAMRVRVGLASQRVGNCGTCSLSRAWVQCVMLGSMRRYEFAAMGAM